MFLLPKYYKEFSDGAAGFVYIISAVLGVALALGKLLHNRPGRGSQGGVGFSVSGLGAAAEMLVIAV